MDTTTLKISSGIPIPTSRGRGGSGLSAIFKMMQPGDSIFIPLTPDVKQSSLTSMCHTAAKNAHIRVTIRKAEECPTDGPSCKVLSGKNYVDHKPVIGYRAWRVDDPSENAKPDGPRISGRQGRQTRALAARKIK